MSLLTHEVYVFLSCASEFFFVVFRDTVLRAFSLHDALLINNSILCVKVGRNFVGRSQDGDDC